MLLIAVWLVLGLVWLAVIGLAIAFMAGTAKERAI